MPEDPAPAGSSRFDGSASARAEPPQRRAGQQVQVDLEHGLAAVLVAVHDDAVTVFGEALLLRVARRGGGQPADHDRIVLADIVERGEVGLRHEQHVHRRLRRDVTERDQVLVLVDDVGRDLAADDPVEDGLAHVASFVAVIVGADPVRDWFRAVSRSRTRSAPTGRAAPTGSPSGCRTRATGCGDRRIPARRPAAPRAPAGWDAPCARAPVAPGNARWPRPRRWDWWPRSVR